MTAGRPTKYNNEMPNKADEYLAQSNDEWTEFHKTRGKSSDSYERIVKVRLPSHERFAEFIGVNTTTLYEWEKEYPLFSKALAKILQEQKNRLVEEGLANNYNPTIAKLVLSSNHGMVERKETEMKGGLDLNMQIVKEAYTRSAELNENTIRGNLSDSEEKSR